MVPWGPVVYRTSPPESPEAPRRARPIAAPMLAPKRPRGADSGVIGNPRRANRRGHSLRLKGRQQTHSPRAPGDLPGSPHGGDMPRPDCRAPGHSG